MDTSSFKETLRAALASPLPGSLAQERMLPEFRRHGAPGATTWRQAAVIVLAYPDGAGGFSFPLVERSPDVGHHRGEMGLPGGAIEPGESAGDAAMREAREELCLVDGCAIELLGGLTPLLVPSGFEMHPFVGWLPGRPAMAPRRGEIAAVVEASLGFLLTPACEDEERVSRDGASWRVPFFRLGGRKVWGATAMVLAELAAALCR